MNKRINNPITCKVCGFETKINGIAYHIKSKHDISVDNYIKKYGEYRPKYLNYQKRSNDNKFICKVCNINYASERHLSYHLKLEHGITKREYIIKHLLHGVIPKCKCGCGGDVPIIPRGVAPYWGEYISGHNTSVTHMGMRRSVESKLKMRESAIKRLQSGNSVFYRGVSNDEVTFREYIKTIYSGEIILNDTKLLSGLEIDVYIPELKIAIELNGERFHSDIFKKRNYHLKKTKECNELGIRLIHIWLTDWYNRTEIVKSQIKNFINKTEIKIYARKCEIREVSSSESIHFLNSNHLQGNTVSKIRYGLYYNNELVQLMTFGKFRKVTGRIHKDGDYELLRLCTILNTVVVGGVSKLFNHFIKTHSPNRILSFANRDWSLGGVYETIGMEHIGETTPGYFYSNGKNKHHRYKFQKHLLVRQGFDANKSEYKIMTERGYYRVWDTGNLIYEWNSSK